MSDGTLLLIRPDRRAADSLYALRAWWSINDVDGGTSTKTHGRGRPVPTPLTGAHCKLTCWPEGNPRDQKAGRKELTYEVSFYAPASLIGNNIFPENTVRLPVRAALACWKNYMLSRYGSNPLVASVVNGVTEADCVLMRITAVYLWELSSAEEARLFHRRLFQHVKSYLDKDLRRTYRDATGRLCTKQGCERVRDDARGGDTFYIDLPWGQARVYIKTRYSKKAFGEFADEAVRDMLFDRAERVVRFELDLDVSKFRHGPSGDESLPLSHLNWSKGSIPLDPYEIIWEQIRKELALDDSLAKHTPTSKLSKLPEIYQDAARAHIEGRDLKEVVPDDKKRSRIINRLRKADFRLHCHIPWAVQKSETWSGWLAARTNYAQRFRACNEEDIATHSLTYQNVGGLVDEFLAKAAGPTLPA